MPSTQLSRWLSIVAISLVSAAAGWKIADSLKNQPEVTPATATSMEDDNDPVVIAETPAPPESNLQPITDTTPAESVLMLKIIFPATEDQKKTAIIQHRDKQANAYETGQTVFNLATLKEINEDHVILLQGRRQIKLTLRSSLVSNNSSRATATNTTSIPDSAEVTQTNVNVAPGSIRDLAMQARARIEADKNARPAVIYTKEPLKSPGNLKKILAQAKQHSIETSSPRTWAFLQYEPDIQVDGLKGLRLSGHEESDFLAGYGIKFGDVITSVNGMKLDNPAAATEGMNIIGQSEILQLGIERSGQELEITVDKKIRHSK